MHLDFVVMPIWVEDALTQVNLSCTGCGRRWSESPTRFQVEVRESVPVLCPGCRHRGTVWLLSAAIKG
jgi:ribosomal protein S27E